MRKTFAAATVAASVALGGLAGAALGTPSLASADDDLPARAVEWVQDALDGLVADDVLTQEQADAVQQALEDARPERGLGRVGDHHRLTAAAEALGMTEDDLATAIRDGSTIAELAEERGVELTVVVDAMVAAQAEHLAEAVADGRLTQEQADEILAGAEERLTAVANGEGPGFGDGMGGRFRGGHGGGLGRMGDADDADDADDSEDAAS